MLCQVIRIRVGARQILQAKGLPLIPLASDALNQVAKACPNQAKLRSQRQSGTRRHIPLLQACSGRHGIQGPFWQC